MKKAILAIGSAVAATIIGAVMFAAPSGAVDASPSPAPFTTQHITFVWQLTGADTATNAFASPQTFVNDTGDTPVPSACGTSVTYQVDPYTITSQQMLDDLNALKATGHLNSPSQDAEFSPTGYTFPTETSAPCVTTVPLTVQPPITPPTCTTDGSLTIPANTESVKFTVNGVKVNDGLGVTEGPGTYVVVAHTTYGYAYPGQTGQSSVTFNEVVLPKLAATNEACVVKTTPPPVVKTTPPVTTPTVTPSTGTTPPVITPVADVTPTGTGLASTGSPTAALLGTAGLALMLGLGAVMIGRRRRPQIIEGELPEAGPRKH